MARSATADIYPVGIAAALIDGALVTPATADALRRRLLPPAPPIEAVLDARQLALLTAVAARLIPQTAATAAIDLAGIFHRRLAGGHGIGWRYADLPAAPDAARRGLDALDASAAATFGGSFVTLAASQQDAILRAVQSGRVDGEGWRGLNAVHWFGDLLGALVDIYYAQPAALDEIGYAGFADALGWQDVGFNARRPHEPAPQAGSPS